MMLTRRRPEWIATTLLAVIVLAPPAVAAPASAPAATAPHSARAVAGGEPVPSDFNGDGYADLAIGAAGEYTRSWLVDGHGEGRVVVLYGSRRGLTSAGSQTWTQGSDGIAPTGYRFRDEELFGDDFGQELATGDFNGDGFADLAIGAPGEWSRKRDDYCCTGVVHVLWGSASGLRAKDTIRWPRGVGLTGDQWRFGGALAAGDLDGDGDDDLAITSFQEQYYDADDPQAVWVTVLKGKPSGIGSHAAATWREDTPGSFWGMALAAGDLDRDGAEDLAVGIPGRVRVLFGEDLDTLGDRTVLWQQDTPGMAVLPGDDPAGDGGFGSALATGDVDGDGYADVAIGAPLQSIPGGDCKAEPSGCPIGAAWVVFGAADLGSIDRSVVLAQGFDGVPGHSELGDQFGAAVAIGDLNRDGYGDLAIGADRETLEPRCTRADGVCGHGATTVLDGSAEGIDTDSGERFSAATAGVPGKPSRWAAFGWALVIAPFGRSAAADLAIAAPYGGPEHGGYVDVLYGTKEGVTLEDAQLWSQASPGVPGSPKYRNNFGYGLGR